MSSVNRSYVFGLGVLGLSLIICALVARQTVLKVKAAGNVITVTGAATQPIKSDLAIWTGRLAASAPVLDSAYGELRRDLAKVQSFLSQQGFADSDFTVGPVQINRDFGRDRQPTGFTLSQAVTLQMQDVDRIARLAQQASTLIGKGVELTSQSPQYLYTKLEDAKLEMIRAATENARLRAVQLADMTGVKIESPVSARVGVFQIRARHSQDVSDYGISDVWSIDKEIVSTVSVSFRIE